MAELSPREIQTRVRAGERPEDLAEQFEVSIEQILRFAETVLQERDRVTFEARRGRARLNGDGAFVEFGTTVDARFDLYGVDPSAVTWDSIRRVDGQWVVTATWIVGLDAADDHSAQWAFNLANRTLSPIDSAAGDLLSDRPVTPVGEDAAFELTADLLVAATETLRPVVSITPDTAPGVAPFPARPEALTGPLPGAPEQVFDQTLFEEPEIVVTETITMIEVVETVEVSEPEPVSNVHNLGVARRAAQDAAAETPDEHVTENPYIDEDESRSTRARIPSWDDILLGVRRKSD
jgi:hypothetical protein